MTRKSLTIKLLSCTLLCALSSMALATVDGGQPIGVLGYDATSKKIYVLRHFEDARGRLPQLYYFDLTAKDPQKLIEVKSIYVPAKDNNYDNFYNHDEAYFKQQLSNIKQRLTPLQATYVPASIDLQGFNKEKLPVPFGGRAYKYQFNYRVVIEEHDMVSALNTVSAAYSVNLNSSAHNYKIPNQPYMLVKVSYLGSPAEFGYDYEEAILLKKQ